MSGTMDGDRADERFVLPWDLSEWVAKETLLQWLTEDIDSLNWENPELNKQLRDNPNYQPRLLLISLSYAFATGLFESEEVASQVALDVKLRALCQNRTFTPREFTRFRRENRGLFKWSLFQVLQRAVREKHGLGNRLIPAGVRGRLVQNASERLDLARHLDRSVSVE